MARPLDTCCSILRKFCTITLLRFYAVMLLRSMLERCHEVRVSENRVVESVIVAASVFSVVFRARNLAEGRLRVLDHDGRGRHDVVRQVVALDSPVAEVFVARCSVNQVSVPVIILFLISHQLLFLTFKERDAASKWLLNNTTRLSCPKLVILTT